MHTTLQSTLTAFLSIFFSGFAFAQDLTSLGGALSTDFPGRHALQLPAPNVTDFDRQELMKSGFSVFHDIFSAKSGLGPAFINSACGGCHIQNGRGPATFLHPATGLSTMVVKVSLIGLNADGSARAVPGIGQQLQDHRLKERRRHNLSLEWQLIDGHYPDGTAYELRSPVLRFRIRGTSRRKIRHSLRMTPAIIGPGLLESIDQETIEALSDPDDSNADGISGKPNYVNDLLSGEKKLGRFGFKASHPTVLQQSAAAAVGDIGITNQLFPESDGSIELSEVEMEKLVVYQKLGGVPFARAQDDSNVVAGKAIFQEIGCDSCHLLSLTTGSGADPELANQEIHPLTDLLLHNMGPALSDRRPEFSADGAEWRTTPLWGLGFAATVSSVKQLFLHDGRARSIEEAILWHGGEAKASRNEFKRLPKSSRAALLAFLNSL